MTLKPVKHILRFNRIRVLNSLYLGRADICESRYRQHLGHSKEAMRNFLGRLSRPSLEAIIQNLGVLSV